MTPQVKVATVHIRVDKTVESRDSRGEVIAELSGNEQDVIRALRSSGNKYDLMGVVITDDIHPLPQTLPPLVKKSGELNIEMSEGLTR